MRCDLHRQRGGGFVAALPGNLPLSYVPLRQHPRQHFAMALRKLLPVLVLALLVAERECGRLANRAPEGSVLRVGRA